jgi:hypothetical protein
MIAGPLKRSLMPGILAACYPCLVAGAHAEGFQAWVGEWRAGDESAITIAVDERSGALLIEGQATFGADDPDRVAVGGVNAGEFSVQISQDWVDDDGAIAFTMAGDRALPFEEGESFDCRIRLNLEGGRLQVEDNHQCGGLNVTFTGTYGLEQ